MVSGATQRERWEAYLVPGTEVLRNLVGATTVAGLLLAEDRFVEWRMIQLRERPVAGRFDLAHVQAVHAHLFQDVYPWAGQLRMVNMSKRDDTFVDADAIARCSASCWATSTPGWRGAGRPGRVQSGGRGGVRAAELRPPVPGRQRPDPAGLPVAAGRFRRLPPRLAGA